MRVGRAVEKIETKWSFRVVNDVIDLIGSGA
jgi:hypothetical protein